MRNKPQKNGVMKHGSDASETVMYMCVNVCKSTFQHHPGIPVLSFLDPCTQLLGQALEASPVDILSWHYKNGCPPVICSSCYGIHGPFSLIFLLNMLILDFT